MAINNNLNQTFNDALAKLNAAQREAVETIAGPVLVVAGPGTGKTQIIAARIGNILNQTDALPQNILCLTYTEAGTVAMRKRLLEFIGPLAYRVQIHTFHSFCNDVIQSNSDYFGKRNLEPISDLETIQLMRNLMDELPNDHLFKKFKGNLYSEIDRLLNLFRTMKEENWTSEFVCNKVDAYLADLPLRDEYIYKRNGKDFKKGDIKQANIDEETGKMEKLKAAVLLFENFQQRMLSMNRYDYNDMILWVVNAFKANEFLLRIYQERFQYFLVDEYQDTNGSQNEILKMLCDFWETADVFAVGDDDQCIYEFQGARLQNILDFEQRHQRDLKKIVLTENYRSSQNILDVVKKVIDRNTRRLNSDGGKKLNAASTGLKTNLPSRVFSFQNIAQEEAFIVTEIERLKNEKVNLNEVAVLYHRHAQAENILALLEKKGIPFKTKKRLNILDLPVIQNIITIFNYLSAEAKEAHSGEEFLFEIMHYAFFGIDVRDIASVAVKLSEKGEKRKWRNLLTDAALIKDVRLRNPLAIEKMQSMINHWLSEMQSITIQMLFEKILNESGLLTRILTHPDKIFQLQVIDTFFNFIKSENAKQPRLKLKELLETIKLLDENKLTIDLEKSTFREEAVQFISTHSAKGLEFQYVYLIGCNSNKWEAAKGNHAGKFSFPDNITFTNEENRIESLRRLFYVACTRAKEYLTITYSENDLNEKPLSVSQFVAETEIKLPEEVTKVTNENMIALQAISLGNQTLPEIKLIDREIIKKRLEGFTLSVTAMNAYLNCPISYYYNSILQVPSAKSDSLAFGNSVHDALKKLYTKMLLNKKQFSGVDVFVQDFYNAMKGYESSFTEKQFKLRNEIGKKLLTNYYNHYIHSFHKNVRVEYPIPPTEMDGIPIKGNVDKIELLNGNEVQVIDYKTGNPKYGLQKLKLPDDKNLNGGDYWRQLVFYRILIEADRRENWHVVSGEIDFIEPDDKSNAFIKQKVVINAEDIKIVKQQIKEVYNQIMQQRFETGCGESDCHWCNFVKENNLVKPS